MNLVVLLLQALLLLLLVVPKTNMTGPTTDRVEGK
jgi:hypothetical protein